MKETICCDDLNLSSAEIEAFIDENIRAAELERLELERRDRELFESDPCFNTHFAW